MQPETVEEADSKFKSLGEKPKWSRPDHKIERNETVGSFCKRKN